MNAKTNEIDMLPISCVLLAICALAMSAAQAASYTAVDLSPNFAFSSANALSSGSVAGYVSATASLGTTRAALWNGVDLVDLHPGFLGNNANPGYSSILGSAQGLQVGWGVGPGTDNHAVPLAWNGTADSASILAMPFSNLGGRALATDGYQIVGYGTPLIKDGTSSGPFRALVWDVASGTASDLGDGGNGAQALGVGGGQQVGYVVKSLQNAALWKGTAKSLIILHPKDAVMSAASGTDGTTVVGHVGYDIRVRQEANKGNKTKRFYYATVWSGSAASAVNIHPYLFTHSFATAVKGQWIAGYAGDESKIGTPAYYHAIAWDGGYQATDLNSYLPSQFVGSQAFSVDDDGNVAGMALTADGQRHAIVWIRNNE